MTSISPTPEIIADIQAGRMVILVDEEDRENEGDLLIAAEFVTPEAINFMATHGRGLICLTLTEARCRQLNLPLMVSNNRSQLGTNFTVSIEAARGRHHRHFRGRPCAHRAGRSETRRAARGHRPARPHLSADGAHGRRAGARRPHRGRLRPGAAGGAHAGSGDLRDPQGRRRNGAAAGSSRTCRAARPARSARSPT